MPENYFGEGVAERYDESSPEMFDPAVVGPVVDFLAGLAGDGPALELGIGTGRIAIPSAAAGSGSMGSTCRRRWWPSCGPSRAAATSA
jgi:hypothetical protein